jgi:benzylsuccinate CoA-transferase BbsE subunit
MKLAGQHELMIFPVLNVPDNLGGEQLKARDYWQQVKHPELGATVTYPGPPLKLSATPWRIRGRAPLLGEHNTEVYGEIGLTTDDLQALSAARVV